LIPKLSAARRHTFIAAILTSIPTHVFRTCPIPWKFITTLENVFRQFLRDKTPGPALYLVAWERPTTPWEARGLQLRNLTNYARALIGKQAAKYLMEPANTFTQWITLMQAQYDTLAKCPTKPSWVWQALQQVLPVLRSQKNHSIRNRMNTTIWFDIWLKPQTHPVPGYIPL